VRRGGEYRVGSVRCRVESGGLGTLWACGKTYGACRDGGCDRSALALSIGDGGKARSGEDGEELHIGGLRAYLVERTV